MTGARHERRPPKRGKREGRADRAKRAKRAKLPHARAATRSRRPFATLVRTIVALVVAGGLAYGVLWHAMADAMRARVAQTIAEARARGFVVRIPRIDETGFPGRVAVALSGLSARFAGDGTRIVLSLGAGRLASAPWRPDRLHLAGRDLRFALGVLDLAAERIEGSAERSREGTGFVIALDRAAFFLPLSGRASLHPARMRIAGLIAPSSPRRRDRSGAAVEEAIEEPLAWRIGVLAEDIVIGDEAPARRNGRRPAVAAIEMQIAWHGPGAWPATRTRLARWRDAGGTLDIERFSLHMGASVLEIEGTLSIDERMRPLGAFTLRVERPRPLLDALVLHGIVSLPEARAITRRIAARERETGARGRVELPLTIEEGRIVIDGVPVGRLGPLG